MYPINAQPIGTGVTCGNHNCIVADPAERQYAANKFYVVEDEARQHCKLRCVYCETDIEEEAAAQFVVSEFTRKTFSPGLRALAGLPTERLKHLVIYRSEADAVARRLPAARQRQESARRIGPCPSLLARAAIFGCVRGAIRAARFRSAC